MIKISHVSRTYGGGTSGGAVRALDDVSLEIAAGTCLAVTGPSGCGKSTLLNILGGLDAPDAGEVWVGGLALHGAGDAELTAYRRHRVGIVFQFFNLLPAMTVAENIELPLLLRGDGRGRSARRVEEMLALVGLGARAGHFPHQLSGGEMQRVAFARALAGSPDLILADEPTGNLDSGNAAMVTESLLKIASHARTTMVIVTHSADLASALPAHIAMRDGKIVS